MLLYGFVANDGANKWDKLGLSSEKCCGSELYNPANECCCKKTGKIYTKSEPFAWDGIMALTEFGYYAAFSMDHCNLTSNVSDDCKVYEVDVTAMLGGVGTGITIGGVISAIRFETFPMYPEGFKGYASLVSGGFALVGGASSSLLKLGEAVSTPSLDVQLGVEYPGAFAGFALLCLMQETGFLKIKGRYESGKKADIGINKAKK